MEVITQFSKYAGKQGVYAIININRLSTHCPNGTAYVGQSASEQKRKDRRGVSQRLFSHRSNLRKGNHRNPRLQAAWKYYEEASFVFVFLEEVLDRSKLAEREQYWMDRWRSYDDGYNCCRVAEFQLGHRRRSDLTEKTIKKWVEKHLAEQGRYPSAASGQVKYAPSDEPITWQGISACLMNGFRGLPGGRSLPDFIADEFGVVTKKTAKKLSENVVLSWVEKYYDSHGFYPTQTTTELVGCPVEYGRLRWVTISQLLKNGQRGLMGGKTLRKLIEERARRPIRFKTWYNKKEQIE